jgi:DNA-binding protein WhiA
MSYSSEVKNELCHRLSEGTECCARSAAYGALLFGGQTGASGVRIVTAHNDFAEALPGLFKRGFGVTFDSISAFGTRGKTEFCLTDRSKLSHVFDAIGYEPERDAALRLNRAVPECEECLTAFVRGAFLAAGSVTDPKKSYHLELTTNHFYVSRETLALLEELDVNMKSSTRKGNALLYLKSSESIADTLTLLGAPISAMQLMNAKLEKELRGGVSRRVNCDSANAGKIAEAAVTQLRAIKRLRDNGGLSKLSEPLQAAAALRLANPDTSLSELAALAGVSKSGLAHRLRQLTGNE